MLSLDASMKVGVENALKVALVDPARSLGLGSISEFRSPSQPGGLLQSAWLSANFVSIPNRTV